MRKSILFFILIFVFGRVVVPSVKMDADPVLGRNCSLSQEEINSHKDLLGIRGIFVCQDGDGKPKVMNIREFSVDIDSPFFVGSISKQFTAAAIVSLEHQGKLSQDDLVCKFIKEFCEGELNLITIRHLMRHQSGLRYSVESRWVRLWTVISTIFSESPVQSVDRNPRQRLLKHPLTPLEFKPGEDRQYSNLGFVALSVIIEAVLGIPIDQGLKKLVFDPLQMKNTELYSFNYTPDRKVPRSQIWRREFFLWGQKSWYPTETVMDIREMFGAGAVQSSASDLIKWMRALKAGQLSELTTEYSDGLAVGWLIEKKNAAKTYFYEGEFEDIFARISWSPDKNKMEVLLCNSSCGDEAQTLFKMM